MLNRELKQGLDLMVKEKEEGLRMVYGEVFEHIYVRAMEFVLDEEEASKLVQSAFVQIYREINQLDHLKNAYAWMCGITYRKGMEMFRKKEQLQGVENQKDVDVFEVKRVVDMKRIENEVYIRVCNELGLVKGE